MTETARRRSLSFGAEAAAYLAADDAKRGLVTLDMGGTSCDIAFIEGGAPLEVTEAEVARRRLDVPALDLTTISAGGGSIAWIGFDGAMDSSIVIRTLVVHGDRVAAQAGGGIVADSDPSAEFVETMDKAWPLLQSLDSGDPARERVL